MNFFKMLTLFSIFTVVVMLGCSASLRAQAKGGGCDSLSKGRYFALVRDVKKLMDKHAAMSVSDERRMVKGYNTLMISAALFKDALNKDHLLEDFRAEFNKVYYYVLKRKYTLVATKGGTEYLRDLDLYIGMGPTYRCQDFYGIY